MRKIGFILALILSMAGLARAQQNRVLTAASATCTTASCLTATVDPTQGGATFTITANASGNTISFEASGDGGKTIVAISATPSNSSTSVTSTTGTGTWQVNTAGYTNIYLIMTNLVSGTTTVSIIQSTASARGGSGGGGGGSGSGIVNPVTSGLMADCSYLEGSGTTSSCGAAGNLTFGCTSGANPTWVAASAGGGLSTTAASTQCGTFPSLNGAQTVIAFISANTGSTSVGAATYWCVWCGNGNGSMSNNIDMLLSDAYNVQAQPGGQQLLCESNNSFSCGLVATAFNGIGSIAATYASSNTILYVNGVQVTDYTSGLTTGSGVGVQGNQNTGTYQMGGTPAGSGLGAATWATMIYYRHLFYNRVLTPTEIAQVHNWLALVMSQRGVNVQAYAQELGDEVLAQGDSITGGNGLSSTWVLAMTLNSQFSNVTATNNGMQGLQCRQMRSDGPPTNPGAFERDSYFRQGGKFNIMHVWCGTNDMAIRSATPAQTFLDNQAYNVSATRAGWKVLCATMISRTGQDANKNAYNALYRENWRTSGCYGLSDIASDPLLGSDGASAGSGFQGDGTHPNQAAANNDIAFIVQRNVNSVAGNWDFSSGNTYASTTTAAITITAASEATNTMTFTQGSGAPPVGSCVVVAGVTPAGYNSPTTTALPCWHVLTSNLTTSWTAYNNTTGLGVGTIFGTMLLPQELDVDVYATLGGTGALNHVLQSCIGRTGSSIFRRITDTSAWTITPITAGETINGGATYTSPVATAGNNPIVRLDSILTSASAGGCTWKASIQ